MRQHWLRVANPRLLTTDLLRGLIEVSAHYNGAGFIRCMSEDADRKARSLLAAHDVAAEGHADPGEMFPLDHRRPVQQPRVWRTEA